MKLAFIPLDKLSVSKANMRHAKKAPDVSDILPTVRKRGIVQTLIVRPNCEPDCFEILAGRRRFHAAKIVAEERGEAEPLPCAILDEGDDAAAIEASMIENMARLDPDEVTRWEAFTRLVREGRDIADIATTFGLPELAVKRALALGNLLPRIRELYAREEIDATSIRHLTMASKSQQKAWLALVEDSEAYAPRGHQLKGWLFGGQSIATRHALFDVQSFKGPIVSDLFGEDNYFADSEAFWEAQNAAIAARRASYLEEGWSDCIIVPPSGHFSAWEYEKASKRKGGRIYIDVRATGEVVFHEGYVSRREAERLARTESGRSSERAQRPEVSGPLQSYIDLHRQAAVRSALLGATGVALRLMVAHAIAGSPLWQVRVEPQAARSDDVAASLSASKAEAVFDERRDAVLLLLGLSPDEPALVSAFLGDAGLSGLFRRLLELPDAVVLDVVAIVMGETLACGSPAVEAAGLHLGIDMAEWWEADDAFFELVRDREIALAVVADVAGDAVAQANEGSKAKALKAIVRNCLEGQNGREKVERWVPHWMAFPPSAYTARGGVGTVAAFAIATGGDLPLASPEVPEPVGDDLEPDRLAA